MIFVESHLTIKLRFTLNEKLKMYIGINYLGFLWQFTTKI